jgi:hypothetical protein
MGAALERLEPFVGEWEVEVAFDFAPEAGRGWTTFEWDLGGQFLLQRSGADHPDAPDGLCIIAVDGDAYTQHYFDSRGVVRVYAMTFDGTTWTLVRDAPDFTPLDFAQRFTGTFADADTIEGRWEIAKDGTTWERDFDLVYRRK